MSQPRAILFDLDDTLYPRVRFVMSGFRAVAAEVAPITGLPAAAVLDLLATASVTQPGRELQMLVERLRLGAAAVPRLIDCIRQHVPDLQLPALSRTVLATLASSWRLGIVTNGRQDIQARKVQALGLDGLVDTVVYASEIGSGGGKPNPAPFLEACRRLQVAPSSTAFVGDDPACDIAGAHAVGMKTIWLPAEIARATDRAVDVADVVVASLADVPGAAARLFSSEWRAHAA